MIRGYKDKRQLRHTIGFIQVLQVGCRHCLDWAASGELGRRQACWADARGMLVASNGVSLRITAPLRVDLQLWMGQFLLWMGRFRL